MNVVTYMTLKILTIQSHTIYHQWPKLYKSMEENEQDRPTNSSL